MGCDAEAVQQQQHHSSQQQHAQTQTLEATAKKTYTSPTATGPEATACKATSLAKDLIAEAHISIKSSRPSRINSNSTLNNIIHYMGRHSNHQ